MRHRLSLLLCSCLLGCGDKEPVDSSAPDETGDSAPAGDSDDTAPWEDTGPQEPAEVHDLGAAHARVLGSSLLGAAGINVVGVGDVDGDGHDDLLVGSAQGSSDGGRTLDGLVYLMTGPLDGDLSTDDAVASLGGPSSPEWTPGSYQLCRAGDMDGDGFADLVLGVHSVKDPSPHSGTIHLQYGPVSGALSLGDADLSLYGSSDLGAGSYALAVGDPNGDGTPDLWVGDTAHEASVSGVGAAYLFLGPLRTGATTDEADLTLVGEEAWANAGYAVDCAGDVDGDGLQDLIVSAPMASASSEGTGCVFVVRGAGHGVRSLEDADGIFHGEEEDDGLGLSVASADLDGDGYADIVLGAPGSDRGGEAAGTVYVVPGTLTGEMGVGTAARWILTGVEPAEAAGHSVASAADADGDSCDDLLVGAVGYDEDRGQVYLIRGPDQGVMSLAFATARVVGEGTDHRVAYGRSSLGGAGDLTGDGTPDWVVGAGGATEDINGQGIAYLWSGESI